MVEMAIAITVGLILLGIAHSAFGEVQNRFASQQGLQVFQSLHARARAQAVEGGVMTQLWVHSAGDSAWITRRGQTLETIRFDDELGVEIVTEPSFFRLCMSPRGFADTDCNSFAGTAKLEFSQGLNARTVAILQSGQLVFP